MKLFSISEVARVHVFHSPVNMNLSFTGLEKLSRKMQGKDGDLFVFVNRKQNYIKLLFKQGVSDIILARRLQEGCGFMYAAKSGRMSHDELERWICGSPRVRLVKYTPKMRAVK